MPRIIVLGCAGTGKSTLARSLAQLLSIPAVELDQLWNGPVTTADLPAFRDLVTQAHAGDYWVSDGNFAAATFDIRLPRATHILWMEAPRWRCALRATKRAFRGDPHHRIARLPNVLRFIAQFDRINRPRIEALRTQYAPTVPVRHVTAADRPARLIETFLMPEKP